MIREIRLRRVKYFPSENVKFACGEFYKDIHSVCNKTPLSSSGNTNKHSLSDFNLWSLRRVAL
jgi:hypothetical protein